jgi:hypothetical protein
VQKYEEWKRSLPEMSLPDWARFDETSMRRISERYEQMRGQWENRDILRPRDWAERLRDFRLQLLAPQSPGSSGEDGTTANGEVVNGACRFAFAS